MNKQHIKDLNIGLLIKKVVDEQHWSYAEFARAINCSRSSLYNIFNSRDISVLRLMRISEVLDYDFIEHIYFRETPAFLYLPLCHSGIDVSALPLEIVSMLKQIRFDSVKKNDGFDQS